MFKSRDELIKGKYYTHKKNNTIIRYDYCIDGQIFHGHHIGKSSDGSLIYCKEGGWYYPQDMVEASPFEEKWLKRCISKGELVPREEIIGSLKQY